MSTEHEYAQYIISPNNSFRKFIIEGSDIRGDEFWKPSGLWVRDNLGTFHRVTCGTPNSRSRYFYNDSPEYWDMTYSGKTRGYIFWRGGYVNDRCQYKAKETNVGIQRNNSVGYDYEQYWWCRSGDWFPMWGHKTIQRANLMRNIRTYWFENSLYNKYTMRRKL